jgi:hypothetical protein
MNLNLLVYFYLLVLLMIHGRQGDSLCIFSLCVCVYIPVCPYLRDKPNQFVKHHLHLNGGVVTLSTWLKSMYFQLSDVHVLWKLAMCVYVYVRKCTRAHDICLSKLYLRRSCTK